MRGEQLFGDFGIARTSLPPAHLNVAKRNFQVPSCGANARYAGIPYTYCTFVCALRCLPAGPLELDCFLMRGFPQGGLDTSKTRSISLATWRSA